MGKTITHAEACDLIRRNMERQGVPPEQQERVIRSLAPGARHEITTSASWHVTEATTTTASAATATLTRERPAPAPVQLARACVDVDPFYGQRAGESVAAFARRLCRWQPDPGRLALEVGAVVTAMRPDRPEAWHGCHTAEPGVGVIEVRDDLDDRALMRVMAHELGHALGIDSEQDARGFARAYLSERDAGQFICTAGGAMRFVPAGGGWE